MTLSPTTGPAQIKSDVSLELRMLDPKSLVIGTNVRIDPKLDEHLIASIKARGVKTPISAYQAADGRVVVLRGQRRTMISAMVGRPVVPVVIEPEPDEADRVVDQLGENDHRAGLGTQEHVAAYEQLAAYGLSIDEIAAMTATSKDRVDAGLRVAGSAVARAVVAAKPDTDLFQAAVLEEFADDPEAVSRLKGCIEKGLGFGHWAQHYREQRLEAQEQAAAEQLAVDEGFIVYADRPAWDDPKRKQVDYLKDGRRNLTSELHADCPGRAVTVYWAWRIVNDERVRVWLRNEWCDDYEKHGHTLWVGVSAGKADKGDLTPEQRREETEQRRRVIKFNALWRSATSVRHEFLTSLLGRKKAPKGAGGITAAALTVDRNTLSWSLQRGSQHAHKLFGLVKAEYHVSDELRNVADGVSEDRAEVIALCMVLAAYEDGADERAWRVVQGWAHRYLRFLQSAGYELSDVEKIAAGLTTVADVEAALSEVPGPGASEEAPS